MTTFDSMQLIFEEIVEKTPAEIQWEKLCATVETVDSEAAIWMRKNPPEDNSVEGSSTLMSAFTWTDTPQGHSYWYHIYKKLYKPS